MSLSWVHRRCRFLAVIFVAVSLSIPVVVDAHYISLSSLALLLLPLSTPQTVAREGSWGSCNGDQGGGHPRPHSRGRCTVGAAGSSRRSVVISLPVDVVVVSTPRVLLIAAVAHRRPVLPPAIHPTHSGAKWPWNLCFFLSFSSCSPFPPRKQLLAAAVQVLSWCQLDPAVRRPVAHPASRGSQQWCGLGGAVSCFVSWGVAMWLGVLTSCLSHFPGLPDTTYAASHLICRRRRGWVSWDSPSERYSPSRLCATRDFPKMPSWDFG